MTQLADTLAREHTTEAIGAIVDVMRDEFSKPGEVLAAAQALLDRGHGKPTQAIITIPAAPRAADQLASMSDADLLAAIGAARIARQRALPALESTANDADIEPANLRVEDDPLCA